VRAYANAKETIAEALAAWRRDVEEAAFPGPDETLG